MTFQQTTQSARPDDKREWPGTKQDKGRWQQSRLERMNEERVARGLGWFSIGLGLAEVIAPQGLAKLIGVSDDRRALVRMLGLREIASGIGILAQRRPAGWLWSRVLGDMIDLAFLGGALMSPDSRRDKVVAAMAAVLGVTALDIICSQQLSRSPDAAAESGTILVKKAIRINRSPEEIYHFWRDFQNLPRFMKHLESVQVTGENRSHWTAKAPAGMTVEWDAEITDDRPNELIAWRSLEGADVDNSGSVRFERAPGGRGTAVKVEISYNPPAGVVGSGVAKLFGEEPDLQVQEDLRRLKQVLETGEVITTEGQPAGRSSSTSWRFDRTVRR